MVTVTLPVPPTGISEETETTSNSASGEAALPPPPLCAAALDARAGALLRACAPAVPVGTALDDALGTDAPADDAAPDGVLLDAFGAALLGAVPLDAAADGVVLRCVPAAAPDEPLRTVLLAAPDALSVVAAGDAVACDSSPVDVGADDDCVVPSSLFACSLVVAVSAPIVDSTAVVSVAAVGSSEVDSEIVVFGSAVESSPAVSVSVSDDGEEFDELVCSLTDISVPFADSPSGVMECFTEPDNTDSTLEELFADRFEPFTSLEPTMMKPVTLP